MPAASSLGAGEPRPQPVRRCSTAAMRSAALAALFSAVSVSAQYHTINPSFESDAVASYTYRT